MTIDAELHLPNEVARELQRTVDWVIEVEVAAIRMKHTTTAEADAGWVRVDQLRHVQGALLREIGPRR